MSDISTLGLGLMGSALARSLVNGGHDVTVWNRSPAKIQPLVDAGAAPAASVARRRSRPVPSFSSTSTTTRRPAVC